MKDSKYAPQCDDEVCLVELKPTQKVIAPPVEQKAITTSWSPPYSTYRPSTSMKKMSSAILAYIVGGGHMESRLFADRVNWDATSIKTLGDVFVWTGGEDINPALYNEEPHSSVRWTDSRDKFEVDFYETLPHNVMKLGICRGGQLLNVLNGGKLYQHVDNHHGTHPMKDLSNNTLLQTNSIHHQMMIPGPGAQVLAAANMSSFRINASGEFLRSRDDFDDWSDPEIIWYPKTNSLCIQGHPEYSNCPTAFKELVFDLLETHYYNLLAENATAIALATKNGKMHDNDLGDIFTRGHLN